jgi:gliding motility-associated lipoprotein GldH
MKRIKRIFLIFSTLIIVSCDSKAPVFEGYFKFEHNSWDRFKQVVFNIPVDKTDQAYDISIILKPDSSFVYDEMPVYVIMTTPSGEERMTDVKVKVKKNGAFIGATEGKPVVVKEALWKGLMISDKGMIKLSLENMVPKIQTSGIAEVGIVVEKATKEEK